MREIKFRVWNGMQMEYDITVGKFGVFYVNPMNGDGLDPEDSASLTSCNTKYPEETPVMQYTGLKDKNGKEIYEGDVVKWIFNKWYWEAVISTVENNQSNTLYAIETFHNCTTDVYENNYIYERSDSRKGSRNDIEYLSKTVEVIGNIYENPELI